MINISICDDNIKLTSEIESLILNYEKKNKVNIDVFFSGTHLLKSIYNKECYDLIFLDIEMEGINGIDVAREIRKIDKYVLIIYITSHLKFAPSAFEVNAFRFLAKPIDQDKFKKYYDLAISKIIREPKYFRYTFKRENFKIPLADILYFESEKRITYVNCTQNHKYKCYIKLKDIEKHLNENNIFFYRVSQSFLINPYHVFSYKFDRMVLKNNEEIYSYK